MAAVIIRLKDVDRLAKELLKETFDFLHNEYILSHFEEIKKKQKKFLRNLVLNEFKYNNSSSISKRGEFDENKFEDELNKVKDAMKNGSISNYVIFHTLNDLDIGMEIDGDLYCKKEVFLNLYQVIEGEYKYLED